MGRDLEKRRLYFLSYVISATLPCLDTSHRKLGWGCRTIIPALTRLRHVDHHELEARVGYIMNSNLNYIGKTCLNKQK